MQRACAVAVPRSGEQDAALDLAWVALPDNVRKPFLRLTVSRPFDQGQQRGSLPQVPMQPVLDAQAEEFDAPPGEPRTWDDFLDEDFPDLDDLDVLVITTPVQDTTFFTQLDDDQWDAIAIDENVSKVILAPVPVVPVQDTLIPDPEIITGQSQLSAAETQETPVPTETPIPPTPVQQVIPPGHQMVATVVVDMLLTDDLASSYYNIMEIYGNEDYETLLGIVRRVLNHSELSNP